MLAGWLRTVAVTGFITGTVRKIMPHINKSRIVGAVKLISALIMIIAVLLPLFNLVSDGGESLKTLFSPVDSTPVRQTGEQSGLFVKNAARETVEKAIKAMVAGDIGRDDFDVYIAFSQNTEGITVKAVTLSYPKKADFPSVYIKEILEEKLGTEVTMIEKDD